MLIIACLHTKTPRGHFGAFLVYLLIIAFISFIKTLQAPGLVLWTSLRVTRSSIVDLWV